MSLHIAYDGDLLEEIRAAAVDRFQRIPRGGMEMGGLLLGTRNGHDVLVQRWEPVACEYARGPVFELSEKDQAEFQEQLQRGEGPQPVGWFRSRRQGAARPKPEDMALHYRYFPEPGSFFLVLRPSVFGPTQAAIFLADKDGKLSETPAHEFELEAAAAPVPRVARPPIAMRERGPSEGLAVAAGPAAVSLPVPPSLRALEDAAPRRFHWPGTATAVLVAVLIVSAAFLAAVLFRPESRDLSLAVGEEDGRRLRVQWDRGAVAGGSDRSGALEINDGGLTRTVPMNGETLDAGSAIYTRLTDDVQFRLVVRKQGQPELTAETRYLGAGSARRLEADPARLERQVQELIRERDELKARVEKLTERAVFAERQLQKMKAAGR